jgi:aminoglycoside 6'-N-acetyltransferase I
MLTIKEATKDNLDEWVNLRSKLWPPSISDNFEEEVLEILADPKSSAFLAFDNSFIGLVEISIHDYADGCDTRNVGFIEGLYAEPAYRRRGIAKLLIDKSFEWFKVNGCREVASDSLIDNQASIDFHLALGFNEVERVVKYARLLS